MKKESLYNLYDYLNIEINSAHQTYFLFLDKYISKDIYKHLFGFKSMDDYLNFIFVTKYSLTSQEEFFQKSTFYLKNEFNPTFINIRSIISSIHSIHYYLNIIKFDNYNDIRYKELNNENLINNNKNSSEINIKLIFKDYQDLIKTNEEISINNYNKFEELNNYQDKFKKYHELLKINDYNKLEDLLNYYQDKLNLKKYHNLLLKDSYYNILKKILGEYNKDLLKSAINEFERDNKNGIILLKYIYNFFDLRLLSNIKEFDGINKNLYYLLLNNLNIKGMQGIVSNFRALMKFINEPLNTLPTSADHFIQILNYCISRIIFIFSLPYNYEYYDRLKKCEQYFNNSTNKLGY